VREIASARVRRSLRALAAVFSAGLAVVGCGSSNNEGARVVATTAPTETATAQSGCASQQQAGIVAVFGQLRTPQLAQRLAERALASGFEGLVVERRGCNDYAVVLHGLRDLNQAHDFSAETARVGFHVRIECRSHPAEGGLAAVFGHRRTEAAALRLKAKAEHLGFEGLQVQQDRCNDWEVDLHGLRTAAQRREFAREARSVGFHIVYEPG
jgi:hypothetical protein